MFRKNIYKWHRTCSVIIAVPVLLWALSGFMHPIMTNLRPAVKMQSIPVQTPGTNSIKLPLKQVLQQNHIDSIYSVRLVHIDSNWFYQVKTGREYGLEYISAKNGNILAKGDWLYAQYIARIFLEGPANNNKTTAQIAMPANMPLSGMLGMTDCCGDAANTVLNNKTGAPVDNASIIRSFNAEYKSIYCLLPVYEVSFKRDDHIRLYVETAQDRFALAVDRNRAAFTTFFDLVHTWGWIGFLGKGRMWAEIVLTALAFVTTLMGIYIFFTTKSKKVEGNALIKSRRNHRFTAIVASLFTLMFTFSGCYHAFTKLSLKEKQVQAVIQGFATADLDLDLNKLQADVKKPVANIGIINLQGKTYWQVYLNTGKKWHKSADLMKDMGAAAPALVYVNAKDYTILKDGDKAYAEELATLTGGHQPGQIVSAELITKFTNEYNFTDKRLPVWKISYPFNHHERLYVETSSGVLAKTINDTDLYEGYSFALFHKHHYMDFAGKTTRDASTMIAAALQLLMVIIGLILYFRWRSKTK
jgi:hypothetical protein